MREIEFQEVGMENFGPYIEPMIHNFENDKIILITGRNGVGKTMSLEALPFTFFGTTTKKDFKGDDAVNDVVGKNCKTWVKFRSNEDQYKVTRYQKYSKYGNTVIVNKNGTDILKGQREVLPYLEKIVCPQKAFMNTLMFGQKVKDFFTDLVDSDKKEIFRKILNLMQYVLYYKEVDEKLKKVKEAFEKITNSIEVKKELYKDNLEQIETLKKVKRDFFDNIEREIKELKQSSSESKRILKAWQDKLNELESNDLNITAIENQLTKLEIASQSAHQKTQDGLIQLNQSKEIKIAELTESANEETNKVTDEINKQIDELNETQKQYDKELNDYTINFQTEQHKIETKILEIELNIRQLTSNIQEMTERVIEAEVSECPTCDQEVSEETKEKLIVKTNINKQSIQDLETELASLKEEKERHHKVMLDETKKMHNQISDVTDKISKLKLQLDAKKVKIKQRLDIAKHKVDEIVAAQKQKIIDEVKSEFLDLANEQHDLTKKREEILKLHEQIDEVKQKISNIEQENISITERIKFKEQQEYDDTQLKTCENKKVALSEVLSKLSDQYLILGKQIDILQFWKSAFSPNGIPSMLIDDAIPFMNKQVNEYLDLLSNGRYMVSFDTQDEIKTGELRDKISVRVIDTQTRANSRVKLSGGQTRLIDIATILTLGDLYSNINDVKFNILIFDEIFDALDYDNIGYVCKILNKLKIGKSVWIISHNQQDQLEADEILTLT